MKCTFGIDIKKENLVRKNVTMYIPTINRVKDQKTWDTLPAGWKKKGKTFLVCPESEAAEHHRLGRNVLIHPTSCTHIGRVRQWIVDNAKSKFILMCDDDHRFYTRKYPDKYNLKYAEESDMIDMLACMEDMLVLGKFHHIGMGSRQGNNRQFPADYLFNTRVNNFHGFNRETLIKHNVRFDTLPLMEDFHVTLSMLKLGYQNKLLVKYCWGQSGSNAPGGCSGYRNNDLQKKSAHMLKELHPEFVKIVEKTSKWQGGMETRTDAQMQWKKAYKSSQDKE